MIILVLGDGAVGKSEFCDSIVAIPAKLLYSPTQGMDIRAKHQLIPGSGGLTIPIELWDIGGSSLSNKNIVNAIVMADIILLFYDITHLGSFYRLEGIIKLIRSTCGLKPLGVEKGNVKVDIRLPYTCLVSCKTDLESERVVTKKLHDELFKRGQFHTQMAISNRKSDLSRSWLINLVAEANGFVTDSNFSKGPSKVQKVKRSNSLVKELRKTRNYKDQGHEGQSWCSLM